MEIEGLINHTLAALMVDRDFMAKKMLDNKDYILFWKNIKSIHANEEVKSKLNQVTHIRQILGSEEYMKDMIKYNPEDSLFFMGFPLKTIEFYLHLKDSIENYPQLCE